MNKKCKFLIVFSFIFMVATLQVQAERNKGPVAKMKRSPKETANCLPPGRSTELSLNLVRAHISSNGTMWFSGSVARYEVPKGSGKTSMFSAALWIGGRDLMGQIYVAAMTFNQDGNDYWTGPLKMKGATIDQPTCSRYDRFFHISRIEVERHIRAFNENDPEYVIPQSILDWPGNGAEGESRYLAPYRTRPGNDPTTYQPRLGDYPYYDFANDLCPWTEANKERAKISPWLSNGVPSPEGRDPNPDALPMPPERIWTRQQQDFGWDNMMIYADHVLKGDETIFWILNDKGGPHSESGSPNSIGLEIRVQAFAFATNDELNKMTFYSYEIINRGSRTILDTYFSQWVDPDLGFAYDDYVGCDVVRGMGYCYNGNEIDGTGQSWAYGANPPAVGVNFFQGPYIDPDGTDNPKFYRDRANANGSPAQQEYCRRFVDYVVDLVNEPGSFYVVESMDSVGKFDTLRYNNQFAINGVNFGDGIIDNERFGMRRFVYYNNDQNPTNGNPSAYTHYYNYLRGIWKDGSFMTYGGDGTRTETDAIHRCDFMFPRGTDYCNWGTKGKSPGAAYNHGGRMGTWSEESEGNRPDDRRFMQSAGPFTLRQGACNYVTVGIPWARASAGGVQASISMLMIANDKCQALFENCFKVLDGPDAPNLTIREYDQKLIMLLTNSPLSNNANEDYMEMDPTIPEGRVDEIRNPIVGLHGGDTASYIISHDTIKYDRYYRFEGYQIFQVIGPEVGSTDLDDPSKARLIRQYDIVNFDKNGNPIGRLINWEFDEDLQVSVPKEKVNGANLGIERSFEVTQDVFATGNRQLVNYKTYYFIAIAYAYNEYWPFSIDPNANNGLEGQKLPYLRGRKTAEGRSVTPIQGIPHPPYVHGGGLTLNSDYGSIPNITRIDGQGNGGIALELTQKTIDKILSGGDNGNYSVRELEYEKNAGPLNVKVVDPLRVKPFDYTIVIREADSVMINNNSLDVSDSFYWVLTIDNSVSDRELIEAGLFDKDSVPIREFVSQTTIGQYNEQIILPLGISVGIRNVNFVNRQPEVIKFWESQILGYYEHRDGLNIPKANALYRARLLYSQSEKIEEDNMGRPIVDIVFANNSRPWISGLRDDNINLPSNWIRAGSYDLGEWLGATIGRDPVAAVFSQWRLEDAFLPSREIADSTYSLSLGTMVKGEPVRAFKDYLGRFGTLCQGTWAPYVLASPYDQGPQSKYPFPEPMQPGITEPSFWEYNFNNGRNASFLVANQPGFNQTMTNLYSVDIVITPNKDLWTRAIVLESCPDPEKSEGGAFKNEPRRAISVDKNGNPTPNATDGFGELGNEGMGWFPGYAINLETGERLNIMFSENSDVTLNERFGNLVNGRDMIFNPTSTYAVATKDTVIHVAINGVNYTFPLRSGDVVAKQFYDLLYQIFDNANGELESVFGVQRVWGGMHYVYVCNSVGNTSGIYYLYPLPNSNSELNVFLREPKRNFNLDNRRLRIVGRPGNPTYGGFLDAGEKYPEYDCGPYDEARWLVQKFKQVLSFPKPQPEDDGRRHTYRADYKMQLFNNVMYTHIPMQPEDPELQRLWMSSDVTYKIRVTRPYMRYASRWFESPEQRQYNVPAGLDNHGFPVYRVSTRDLAPTFHDTRVYQSLLDNINIVPNPYYGGSLYEGSALETMVKITNLPTGLKNNAPVTINIYTVSGTLVRTLTKGDAETSFVNWDLKNFANIPIAGGVYIIHVNCPGIGERTLKFFCTMRPTDLNTF